MPLLEPQVAAMTPDAVLDLCLQEKLRLRFSDILQYQPRTYPY